MFMNRVESPVFTDRTRDLLTASGYEVYTLTGRSMRRLRLDGEVFWSTWHSRVPGLENLQSMRSEVAIPQEASRFMLDRSNKKPVAKQLELIDAHSHDLSHKISGARAIMGNFPDYVELGLLRFKRSRDELYRDRRDLLFGNPNEVNLARTTTSGDGECVAVLARYDSSSTDSFEIRNYIPFSKDGSGQRIFVAPLAIPA